MHKERRFMNTIHITTLLLILFHPHLAFSDNENDKAHTLNTIFLDTYPYQNTVIYHYKKDTYFYFGNAKSTSKDDYGPKFLILNKENGAYRTVYESKGSGDSYILKPSFYSTDIAKEPLLILAEIGTEYSWGVRLILIVQDLHVKDLGTLDVAVEPDSDFIDGPESVIPYTHIAEHNGRLAFTFTKDIIYDPGGLNERKFKKEDIRYTFNGKSLKLVTSTE